ncbi:MAG: ParB/RepB/Spo0J family partition protein [Eubacteriales bacterium]
MAKPTGLGKGLGALLSEDPLEMNALDEDAIALQSVKGQVIELDIGLIDTYQDQPRKSFDEEKLNELAKSIETHGIVQPIIVRKNEDRFMIIAGERRYRAARIARLKTIPAIVKEISSREQMEISLIENLQRENLNPLEEAAAIRLLMTEYNLNQEAVSERIGKSRPAVANILRLLQLPEKVRVLIFEGKISSGHAKCLGGLESDDDKIFIATKAAEEGMSVREIEKFVQKHSKGKTEPENKKTEKKAQAAEIVDAENKLTNALETRVKIVGDTHKGKITIEYFSKEQLQALYDYLLKN